MGHQAWADIKAERLAKMTPEERAVHDAAYEEQMARLRRGVAQAEAGNTRSRGDFAQYLEDADDEDVFSTPEFVDKHGPLSDD